MLIWRFALVVHCVSSNFPPISLPMIWYDPELPGDRLLCGFAMFDTNSSGIPLFPGRDIIGYHTRSTIYLVRVGCTVSSKIPLETALIHGPRLWRPTVFNIQAQLECYCKDPTSLDFPQKDHENVKDQLCALGYENEIQPGRVLPIYGKTNGESGSLRVHLITGFLVRSGCTLNLFSELFHEGKMMSLQGPIKSRVKFQVKSFQCECSCVHDPEDLPKFLSYRKHHTRFCGLGYSEYHPDNSKSCRGRQTVFSKVVHPRKPQQHTRIPPREGKKFDIRSVTIKKNCVLIMYRTQFGSENQVVFGPVTNREVSLPSVYDAHCICNPCPDPTSSMGYPKYSVPCARLYTSDSCSEDTEEYHQLNSKDQTEVLPLNYLAWVASGCTVKFGPEKYWREINGPVVTQLLFGTTIFKFRKKELRHGMYHMFGTHIPIALMGLTRERGKKLSVTCTCLHEPLYCSPIPSMDTILTCDASQAKDPVSCSYARTTGITDTRKLPEDKKKKAERMSVAGGNPIPGISPSKKLKLENLIKQSMAARHFHGHMDLLLIHNPAHFIFFFEAIKEAFHLFVTGVQEVNLANRKIDFQQQKNDWARRISETRSKTNTTMVTTTVDPGQILEVRQLRIKCGHSIDIHLNHFEFVHIEKSPKYKTRTEL